MINCFKGPKNIILFGHRKQHGKDTCCDFVEDLFKEKNISYCRTFFAKKLKQMAADRYNLDVNRMEFDEYKNFRPKHLNGKSVRDVLIEIGNGERAKDEDCWVKHAYNDIYLSRSEIGLISDFRFPNEANAINKIHKKHKNEYDINIHKVLIHRPDGRFVSDGADDQLPDLDEKYWDCVIINDDKTENWKHSLRKRTYEVINKCLDL